MSYFQEKSIGFDIKDSFEMNTRKNRCLMKLESRRKMSGRGHSCAAGSHDRAVGVKATHDLTKGMHGQAVCRPLSCTLDLFVISVFDKLEVGSR